LREREERGRAVRARWASSAVSGVGPALAGIIGALRAVIVLVISALSIRCR
jgi:hypothetical protein